MKLDCARWGDPNGKPVVLLHAFPMSARMWEPQKEALKGFDVWCPNLRGFGTSVAMGPWTIEDAAADVLQTVPGKPVFVGLSMGGYVALRIAQSAPGRVRALVLCDTRAEPDTEENKAKRAAAMEFVRKNGVEAFLGPFLKDAVHNPAVLPTLKGIAAKSEPESVVLALAALAARPDAVPGLSRTVVPTAIFVGSHDKITPLPLSEAMRSRIPGAELHIIPDAGHFSNAENPAVFNERLLSFLKRLG